MRKLICMIFCMVFLMAFISAAEWDNDLDYENNDMKVIITNWLGLGEKLGEATLSSHESVNEIRHVIRGEDRVVMWYEFDFTDGYENGLGEVEIINMRTGTKINRDYEFVVATYKEVEKPIYETNCVVNKTGSFCHADIKEYIKVQEIDEWNTLSDKNIPKGKATIGIRMDVKKGDYLDGIWNIAGKKVKKHATWTEALNQGLKVFYQLNETAGTNSVEATNSMGGGVEGYMNLTFANTEDSDWITGLFGKSMLIDASDTEVGTSAQNIGITGATNRTVCAWINGSDNGANNGAVSWGGGANNQEFTLYVSGANNYIGIEGYNNGHTSAAGTWTGTDHDRWQFVCGVMNSTSISIYKNATLIYSVTPGTAFNTADSAIEIGHSSQSASWSLDAAIDEIGIWNRSLSDAELVQLYNDKTGMTYENEFNGLAVQLNEPIDYYNSTTSTVTFNCSSSDESAIQNMSLYINGSRVLNGTSGAATFGLEYIPTLAEGKYNWTCSATDDSSAVLFATNRTVTIDSTAPTVNIVVPSGDVSDDYVRSNNKNISINFTAIDAVIGLDTCWYYNNSDNVTLTCGTNASFTLPYGTYTHYAYANDSLNQVGEDSITVTYSYKGLENSITFDDNVTTGQSTTFTLNMSSDGSESVTAEFFYNGTNYASTKTGTDSEMEFSRVDDFGAGYIGTNSFYWQITHGSDKFNSTINNQSVNTLNITACASGNRMFNLTLYDENTQTLLGAVTEVNVDIDITSLEGTLIEEYSNNFTTVNPIYICIDANLSETTPLRVDAVFQYNASTRIVEFYHIQNFSMYNYSIPQHIGLFDLDAATAQEFKITYKDENFLPVEDALIKVQRKYIDEGVFKTVELPKTDSDGQTLANLVLGDQIYTFIVVKEGEVLGTFENVLAFCSNIATGDCEINLNSFSSSSGTGDWTSTDDITFTLTYNKDTRVVESVFDVTSGATSTVVLNVTLFDNFGNRTLCSDTLTSSSGTLSCTIPSTFGNATAIASLYKLGSHYDLGSLWISLWEDASVIYGTSYITLALLSFLTIVGIGLSGSAALTVFFVVIGGIINVILALTTQSGFVGAGSSFLWLVVALLALLWKANRRRA